MKPNDMITVLVPAHNEQEQIAATIESLLAQTVSPDRIVIIADNCSDDTVGVASQYPVEVVTTTDNPHKKAGAMNQALRRVLSDGSIADEDVVLLMDADSALVPTWLEDALAWLPGNGAVSGAYTAAPHAGVIPLMQHIEYTQLRRRIARAQGRVAVLSGAASLFYVGTLRHVARERGVTLPGTPGDPYRVDSLTEDFEITLAAKRLGYDPRSPSHLVVVTDVMRDLPSLWGQRLRWQRGYIETIASYPLRMTWKHWLVQFANYGMSLLPFLLVALLAFVVSVGGTLHIDWRWLALLPLFAGAELLEAWRGGWKARLVAVALLPNSIYGMVRNAVYWRALWVSLRGRTAVWS